MDLCRQFKLDVKVKNDRSYKPQRLRPKYVSYWLVDGRCCEIARKSAFLVGYPESGSYYEDVMHQKRETVTVALFT